MEITPEMLRQIVDRAIADVQSSTLTKEEQEAYATGVSNVALHIRRAMEGLDYDGKEIT